MTNIQLYFAIGVPVFAIIMNMIGTTLQNNALNARFTSMESNFNARFTSLETNVNARFASIEMRFDTLTGKVVEVDNRLTRLEAILERQ